MTGNNRKRARDDSWFVIDVHAHVADPSVPSRIQAVAGGNPGIRRVFEGLLKFQKSVGWEGGMIALDPSPTGFFRMMDESGTDMAVLAQLGFAEELGGIEISPNSFLETVDAAGKGRFIRFAGVDPRRSDAVAEVERLVTTRGFRGVRINPTDWGCFPLDSPMLEPIFSACERLGVPAHVHTGVDPSGLIQDGNPLLLEPTLLRHPNLVLFLEHYGFPFKHEAYAMCRKHDNVYLTLAAHMNDLIHQSPVLAWLELEEMRVRAGLEKILYGSDYPATPNNVEVIAFLKGARVPSALRKSGMADWTHAMRARVLGLNVASVLGLDSPEIAAVRAKVEREEVKGTRCKTGGPTLPWDDEARARLRTIPAFVRQGAIAKIESVARSEGASTVTCAIMDKARGQ